MVVRYGAHTGNWVAPIALAVLACAIVLATVGVAMAAPTLDDSQLIIDLGGTVYGENCDPCHANISKTDNYASEIIFTHGYHQLIMCSSCHTRFPHRPEGTERPTMKGCFNCHGVQHGPMGELATGKCPDCHKTAVDRLRPSFHTYDWAKKPHVEPSNKELQTKCMMCHDGPFCDDCHETYFIDWKPTVSYTYDSGGGCLACHGSETLTKAAAGQPKSYQVLPMDDSAHAKLTCQQCHKDYKYEEGADPTPLWNVNAGFACRDCHSKAAMFTEEQIKRNKAVIAEYDASIHATSLGKWLNGTLVPGKGEAEVQPPTCADCHGGHYIQRLDTEYAKKVFAGSAYRVCARCHQAEYDSYDDYYHGAAYKRGAEDSPACWDCHDSHRILPSSDPESTVSDTNMARTCGADGCHGDRSQDSFAQKAGDLIHQKADVAESNPLRRLLSNVRSWFS